MGGKAGGVNEDKCTECCLRGVCARVCVRILTSCTCVLSAKTSSHTPSFVCLVLGRTGLTERALTVSGTDCGKLRSV